MQALAINEEILTLNEAMSSLEGLLNKNNPEYILNAIKYYKSYKKLDCDNLSRIRALLNDL